MGTKISALPQETAPTLTDLLALLDAETTTTKKVLLSAVQTLLFTTPPTNAARLTGEITPYAGRTAPTDWLFCDGTAVNRTTYANLFAVLCANVGTCTITNASPATVTLNGHGFQTGDALYLTTTGTLPTGLSPNTIYYAVRVDANNFTLATSRANAYIPARINTSSAGSGVHTARDCPYGLGDGSTTFNVPDLRGRIIAGSDSIGGTVASRLTLAQAEGVYGNRGAVGGEQGHTLGTPEIPAHAHTQNFSSGALNGVVGIAQTANQSTAPGIASTYTTQNTGGSGAHNNIQPTSLANYLIKT